jgi:hypothetical protein
VSSLAYPSSKVTSHIFDGEESFIIMDRNWDFWRYNFTDSEPFMKKKILHTPNLPFCDLVYLENYGKVLGTQNNCMPWRGLSYTFLPETTTRPPILLLWTQCNCYTNFCHSFQIIFHPADDNFSGGKVMHCNFETCCLIDVECDPESGLVYFVTLSSLPETLFYQFPPIATSNPPTGRCQRVPIVFDYSNLGIFVADLSEDLLNSATLTLDPIFFAPSKIGDLEMQQLHTSVPKRTFFGTTFSHGQSYNYKTALTRLFLLVKTTQTSLLCFPLHAPPRSPPMGVNFGRPFHHFDATQDMMYLCCLPSDWGQPSIPLRLATVCPETHCFLKENYFPVPKKSQNISLINKVIKFF